MMKKKGEWEEDEDKHTYRAAICPKAKGSGEPGFNPPRCDRELKVRRHLALRLKNTKDKRMGPAFVRMVFHDALDHHNLMDGSTGGVDGCLYSPSKESGDQINDHNRNLPLGLLSHIARMF